MKSSLLSVFKELPIGAKKHAPEILTGIGLAGMISATVLAVKATPKAVRLIEEKKKVDNADKFTLKDTVKTAWKCYIPAGVATIASAACIIGASSTNLRRNAALAAAYSISETALREYKDKVVEVVGEKKEQAIQDAVSKARIENNPPRSESVIFTGKGETLCYDSLSGRYFKSDIDKIKKAENETNHRMLSEMCISLNELYYELGLDGIDLGEDLGWHVENGCFEIRFSSQLTPDNTPCLVLDYSIPPKYGFDVPF